MLLHAIAKRVACDAEQLGGTCHIPSSALERLQNEVAFDIAELHA